MSGMTLIVLLAVNGLAIQAFYFDDYYIRLCKYARNTLISPDSELSDMELALDTTKAQLVNAHLQLARANMNDKDILLSQKDAKIKALGIALEDSITQLTEVNLELAQANMATQHQMTLNTELTRRAKKGSKNVTDLPTHIKDLNVGLKAAQEQNVALMKENAAFHEIITTQTTTLTTTNERIASLEKDKDDLTAEKITLLNSLEALQARLDEAHTSIRTKDEDGHDLVKQIQFKADELHTMTLQLEYRDRTIVDLEASLMDQTGSLRNAARDVITDLEDHLVNTELELQSTEHYIMDLEDRLAESEASLQSWEGNMSGSIRAFAAQIAELQDKKAALEHENEKLAKDLRGLVSEMAVLTKEEEEEEVSESEAIFGEGMEGECGRNMEVASEWEDDETFSLGGYDEVQAIEGDMA